MPVAVKDLFDVQGEVTTAGSQVPPAGPAARDALAVARLRRAGAVVVGRTRTHEFAWGVTTWHPRLGGTRNPWDLDRVPGGSSGGSAAAVAAGIVPLALGTDTACSVRLPAAWCGVVGHKPTYGTVPVEGVLPLSPSFDHVGVLTHDADDARLALAVLTGQQLDQPASIDGTALGVADGPGLPKPDVGIGRMLRVIVDRAVDRGMRPRPVSLPLTDRLSEIYRVVQAGEALAWHRSTGRWPAHASAYSDEIYRRLRFCEQVTPERAVAARGLLRELRKRVSGVFECLDLLLMPVAASGPPRIAEANVEGRDVPADLGSRILPWTLLPSLCGLPACSIPTGFDDEGMPVGLQLVGRPGADAQVLDVAGALIGT